MDQLSLYHLFAIFIALVFISKHLLQRLHLSKPLAIPILGHLHLLRHPVHQSLAGVAAKHGHVLRLRFGSRPVLVVSSPSAAEECFTKNDVIFANRPRILSAKHFGYDSTAFVYAPFSPRWRAHRRFTTLHALSPSRLSNLSSELCLLLRGLYSGDSEGFQKTEIRSWLFELTMNLVMGMITGKRYSGEEKRRLRKLLEEMFLLSGATSMEDFVPLARWLGFSSMRRRIETAGKEMDEFLQGLIEERRKLGNWKESNSTIIIDILLSLQEKEPEDYSDVAIKGIITTLINGGTETAAGTMEWTMALLVNHPEAMKKVKDEIGEHVGHARLVMDSDISKLQYLNNVIKETLRLFPVGPLLVPHESSEDCTVAGLHVPKGTMLLVNAYSMQRDPELWEDPLEFKPERFDAESNGDDLGYKYNPFGSGRRRCPGETMAWKVMGLTLAALIQCFRWERVGEELVDLSEGMGLTMPMATPLEVIYKPRPEMLSVLSQL